jgi:hypothetical protein
MASYPSSLPVADPAGANLSSNPHSTLHDDMYDEIVAIATELGTNPKGTAASVKARLDLLEIGAWTTWTPTVFQLGSVTVTNTRSRYVRYGRTIHYTARLEVTGSGTGGNPITVSLPVTAAASGEMSGTAALFDVSATLGYSAVIQLASTTTLFMLNASTAEASQPLGLASFTAGLAVGDTISVGGTYEAAS